MPVKTFLNCTMPALVNIRVGSLRGTNGDDGTISCPALAKVPRKAARMSLTPLMKPADPSRPSLPPVARKSRT